MRSAFCIAVIMLYTSDVYAAITARDALNIVRCKMSETYYFDTSYVQWKLTKNETRWDYLDRVRTYKIERSDNENQISETLKNREYWDVTLQSETSGPVDFIVDANTGEIVESNPNLMFISKYFTYKIDIDDAIKIADAELIKRKYDPNVMVLAIAKATYPTLTFSLKNGKPIKEQVGSEKLKDKYKRIWEVYYHPKEEFETGDIVIIIDSDTGNIDYVFE